ncbi:MAG: GNAT family N-acetyltransferase [Ilumatobacteraceae bacterium]
MEAPTPTETRQRFLEGFAAQVGLERAVFASHGITVVGRDDRAGTGIAACYRVDQHLVVWADPAVVDALPTVELQGARGGLPDDGALGNVLAAAGFEFVAGGVMCTLQTPVPTRPAVPAPFEARRLHAEDDGDVIRVREFLEQCDPDELELAGLADFGDFTEYDEVAINVVVDTTARRSAGLDANDPIVAYSSAMDWDWDPVFADIAVIVLGSQRGRGLARIVTTEAMADIHAMDRLPLYRFRADNVASAHLAAALGFAPVTTLGLYRR